jgi:hypothetical protein
MESLRNYLLSEENLVMIEDISIEKIYKLYGLGLDKDEFFQTSIFMVATAVVREELKKQNKPSNNLAIKINNIIIAEAVKYIYNSLNTEQYSSNIEDLSDEEIQEEEPKDYFEELKKDTVELKPKFEEELLIFDKEETNANLQNIISAELVSFSIDFSDYIINETNNCFKVNDENITIPVGNYSPDELMDCLNDVTQPEILFSIDKKLDKVNITCLKKTSSLKENKSYIIDFDVKNSIYLILGISKQSFNLNTSKITSEIKHKICHPPFIDVEIQYSTNFSEKHRILTNVPYNDTIHYTPKFSKKILLNQQEVKTVKLLTNYNTRGRPYTFSVKFVSVLI